MSPEWIIPCLTILVLGMAGWIGILYRRPQTPSKDNPQDGLEAELRQQIASSQQTVEELRSSLEKERNQKAQAEARLEAAESYRTEQDQLHEKHLTTLKEDHRKALEGLKESFKALSNDALKETHPAFLQLAKETFATLQESARGDLSKRQESIAALVKPLEDHLKHYQKQLSETEQHRSKSMGELKNQLEHLSSQNLTLSQETIQLRRILSSNQARGRWGEETLRRVVEAAGMSAHCDFVEQVQSGEAKPDMIVKLPGDRMIVVDAKVPDLEGLGHMDQADPAQRKEQLAHHVSKLKLTIRQLADRHYPEQFPQALDHVILFMPAESLFSAALEADQDLIVWAAERKILLATPTSLIALLRSVSVSWKQHAQTENARAIASAAEELYRRLMVFVDHMDKIKSGLETASGAYNKAVGSYERSIRPSGERLLKLSEHTVAEMKELTPSAQMLRDAPSPGKDT